MTAQDQAPKGNSQWHRRCVASFLNVGRSICRTCCESSQCRVALSCSELLWVPAQFLWLWLGLQLPFSLLPLSLSLAKLSQLKLGNFAGTRRTHRFNSVRLDWIKWIYHIQGKLSKNTTPYILYMYIFNIRVWSTFNYAVFQCDHVPRMSW